MPALVGVIPAAGRGVRAYPYTSTIPKCMRKNYVGTFTDGRIASLEEKPKVVTGTLMGTGTYVLHPELIARLSATFAGNPETAPRDWTSWLSTLCREGASLRPFLLRG